MTLLLVTSTLAGLECRPSRRVESDGLVEGLGFGWKLVESGYLLLEDWCG